MSYPETAVAEFHAGLARMAANDAEGASACFQRALDLAPDMAEAEANLAILHERAGDAVAAEVAHMRASALRPDCMQTQLNFAVFLLRSKRLAQAEDVLRQVLELAPESADAWSHYGVLLACLQRDEAAEASYRHALQLAPGHAPATFNLAYVLLRHGRFEEGWRCLEARDWYGPLTEHFACPRWQGESLAGKSLVIAFEAGHGDMIQFVRYADVLKAAGVARLSIICQPALCTLFASVPAIDEVLSIHGPVPRRGWDYWTPPLSLPYYCATRLDSIPAKVPYLFADPARRAAWSAQLAPRPPAGRRVGLVWKGNPAFENDRDRSLPSLQLLAPLGSVCGIQFVSLQKGQGEDEAATPPAALPLRPLGSRLTDFADTAALIGELDLVISVDTAVAHLAGALGKPCWVLLPDYKADWRWLVERSDSPWYPHTRLFRQTAEGGWPELVDRLTAALNTWQQTAPCPPAAAE